MVLVIAALVASCRTPPAASPPEDITPAVSVTPARLSGGGPLALTYTWTVGPSARPIRDEHRAFVHVLDPKGVLLFTDDHAPTPAVTAWEPGRTYSYRRLVLSPFVPHVGPVRVVMGLFRTDGRGDRLALRGTEEGRRSYRVAELELGPRERELAVACDGLYPPESSAAAPFAVSRFLRREASCAFPNPGEDVVLFLSGHIVPAGFAEPPTLTVATETGRGIRVPFAGVSEALVRLRLPAAAWTPGEPARFRLAMDASYVPRERGFNQDGREVSLRLLGLRAVRLRSLDPALAEGAAEAASLGQ
jgi:hypothetical protein